ncbi:hypothetical protein HAX54_000083 [Datura stramonium]|uniref:Transmembrane protein n=1 Tax=Datura stramonium TaxID=4076 RepID=A0ABS8RHG7_DATST|nr:hypothetical protein [Datura stramonium]
MGNKILGFSFFENGEKARVLLVVRRCGGVWVIAGDVESERTARNGSPMLSLLRRKKKSGSKPKSKPKREKTEEEKKFRRRAKYFLVTQLVAVLVFLSLLGGSDAAEVELDEDDGVDYD